MAQDPLYSGVGTGFGNASNTRDLEFLRQSLDDTDKRIGRQAGQLKLTQDQMRMDAETAAMEDKLNYDRAIDGARSFALGELSSIDTSNPNEAMERLSSLMRELPDGVADDRILMVAKGIESDAKNQQMIDIEQKNFDLKNLDNLSKGRNLTPFQALEVMNTFESGGYDAAEKEIKDKSDKDINRRLESFQPNDGVKVKAFQEFGVNNRKEVEALPWEERSRLLKRMEDLNDATISAENKKKDSVQNIAKFDQKDLKENVVSTSTALKKYALGFGKIDDTDTIQAAKWVIGGDNALEPYQAGGSKEGQMIPEDMVKPNLRKNLRRDYDNYVRGYNKRKSSADKARQKESANRIKLEDFERETDATLRVGLYDDDQASPEDDIAIIESLGGKMDRGVVTDKNGKPSRLNSTKTKLVPIEETTSQQSTPAEERDKADT